MIKEQQQGFLSSIAQRFDAGDFDYLPPADLQSLNALIAKAWDAIRENGDAEAQIREIEQFLGRDK